MSTWRTGQAAERLARSHLEQHGLLYQQANYRCRHGEIDLVMQQQQHAQPQLVFVEVRYRQQQRYGGAIHSITASKKQHLYRTAQHYLQQRYADTAWPACRFDLIALGPSLSTRDLVWLQNILQSVD